MPEINDHCSSLNSEAICLRINFVGQKMNTAGYTYSIIFWAGDTQENNLITIKSILAQNYDSLELIIATTEEAIENISVKLPFPVQVVCFDASIPITQVITECILLCRGKITTILKSGESLCTACLVEVEHIFSSCDDVSWLTGYLTTKTEFGLLKPNRHNEIRWSALDFYTRQSKIFKYHIPFSGTFVKTAVWGNALPFTDSVYYGVPDAACWLKLFETEKLYTTYLSTAIVWQPPSKYFENLNYAVSFFPQQRSEKAFWKIKLYLLMKRITATFFSWAFVANVPVLRYIQRENFEYQPLINYDMEADTYFFEKYPPTRYLHK
ncbi:MAG: hypothetical protein IPN22_11340 [Bacteroidetes bacterium]|nr:hypothetical protein [Bacteroidota bacterium]